jgi:splicing factor 3A subunit 3
MRALGIPMSKAFYEITTIADALALHRTLQERGGAAAGKDAAPDVDEVEDEEGNIYSRKTWDDLKRQGLV